MSGETEGKAQSEPKKKRGWLKIVLLLVAVIVVAGGSGAGYLWWKSTQATGTGEPAAADGAGGHGTEKKGEEGESGLLSLEPFVVNLADADASRFLRVNLRLVIDKGDAEVKEFEENKVVMTRLRSGILELLATKTSGELGSADGKEALKKEIEGLANKVLAEAKVRDVLFVEFVVQF